MQDAPVTSWMREPHLSVEILESVRELNLRFLDIVAIQARDWSAWRPNSPVAVSAQVAPLSAAQKAAAANCPYALFDLRFEDDCYWQERLRTTDHWGVADASPVDPKTLDFVRLALFFAWHVASTSKFAGQLLLGMHELTVAAFRGITIDRLPPLAVGEAINLTARWNGCSPYWRALTGAASRPNSAKLRRIQLYGLQLTAAARLT
ncbi:MAG: hypothetical protein M3O41_03635 [Pseudomonadota bacterium]|nr:hypothetical protein [Pseudomonadota bacterium]